MPDGALALLGALSVEHLDDLERRRAVKKKAAATKTTAKNTTRRKSA
ncbi:hypothetical protein ABZ946_23830 [Streptomyces sp. NPDC046324]